MFKKMASPDLPKLQFVNNTIETIISVSLINTQQFTIIERN